MALVNLYFAWIWFLAGMLSGAAAGLFFHRDAWLGGFDAWPRRMVRLGHIAFFGTGLLNLGFALSVDRLNDGNEIEPLLAAASVLLIVGAVAMPLICFAAAWRQPLRHLFFIPVVSMVAAVAAVLGSQVIS